MQVPFHELFLCGALHMVSKRIGALASLKICAVSLWAHLTFARSADILIRIRVRNPDGIEMIGLPADKNVRAPGKREMRFWTWGTACAKHLLTRQLRPGMRFVIGAFQSFGRDVSVNLRRGQVGMTQQFLDTAQVGALVQQMGGVTVPQFVRRKIGVETGDFQITFKADLDDARRERLDAMRRCEEDGHLARGGVFK